MAYFEKIIVSNISLKKRDMQCRRNNEATCDDASRHLPCEGRQVLFKLSSLPNDLIYKEL